MRNRHHRRRHNPGIGASLGNLKGLMIDSAWAIGGGVATRSIPQAVLPNQNTGLLGYGLNIATAAIGSVAITKFLKNARAGSMFLLGGIVMTVGRAIDDYFGLQVVQFAAFNPTASPMLSGDAAYDTRVHRRLSGQYVPSNFVIPADTIQHALPAAAVPTAGSAGMGWASRGYNRRAYN